MHESSLNKSTPKPAKCDECEGTGKRYSHVYGGYINCECWFCKGTGIIPVEIVPVEDSDQK